MTTDTRPAILSEPGVLGYTEVDRAGENLVSHGADDGALADVVGYFEQVSRQIGSCLGLDGVEEGHLIGPATTIVIVPKVGKTLGVLLDNRARVGAILGRMRDV